jgi:hypothetical protein
MHSEIEEKLIKNLEREEFKVIRRKRFGNKWLIDLVGKKGDRLFLFEIKAGPIVNADIFELVALRNSIEKSIIARLGKPAAWLEKPTIARLKPMIAIISTGVNIRNEDPIVKVANAGGVKIITGKSSDEILGKVSSLIQGQKA